MTPYIAAAFIVGVMGGTALGAALAILPWRTK